VNRDEAKNILLLYRHGTADADDPQIAEALAMAERDPELKDWLVVHCAREFVVREKFRRISAPAGLKEQIISEQAAQERMRGWRKKAALTAVAAVLLGLMAFGSFWVSRPAPEDTLSIFQNRMARVALGNYAMDVMTNNPAAIRAYLAQHHAPAEFVLPVALQQVTLTGCAVQGWQNGSVSMVCFRTSGASPDVASDLWLFVVDRASVKKSSAGPVPQLAKVNRLMTATWVQGDQLYFLGTSGDAQTIQQFL
jgi:hypothetical protein